MSIQYNGTIGGSSNGELPQPQGGSQAKLVGYFDKNSQPIEYMLRNQYEYVKPKPTLQPSDYPFTAPSSGIMSISYTIYSRYDYIQLTLPNRDDPSSYSFHSLNNNTQTLQAQNANMESIDGAAYNQQSINQQFVKEIKDLKKRSLRMVGYIGSSQPSLANEGDIYYQSSASSKTGNDLPTTFPIQVKVWSNNSWSSTTKAFTPDDNDLITNTNNKLAFVWNKGWTPNNQAQSTTDNITIGRNNNNALCVLNEGIDTQQLKNNSVNNSKVIDNTLTFSKVNTNSVANGLENASNKFVKAEDLFDAAIVSNTTQIQSKTGGGKEIEIDLKNTAGTSITKASIDLDETATQNSNNPITSDGVYKDKLNNTNSSQEATFNTENNVLQLITQLKNNNNDPLISKTTDILTKITDYSTLNDNDLLSFLNISTKELKNVALSAVNTYIQSKLTGAISNVLTNNLTADKILVSDTNGKISTSAVDADKIVSLDGTQTLTNKTIDADDNTITDITGANFKTQDTTEAGKVWGIKNDGTTTLITSSGSGVHYVNTFSGIEGEENALYYLTKLCVVGVNVYERGFYRYTNNKWTFIPASVMRSGIKLKANKTQYLFFNELGRDDIIVELTLPNGERVDASYTLTADMITFTFSQEAVEQYVDERIQVVYF